MLRKNILEKIKRNNMQFRPRKTIVDNMQRNNTAASAFVTDNVAKSDRNESINKTL